MGIDNKVKEVSNVNEIVLDKDFYYMVGTIAISGYSVKNILYDSSITLPASCPQSE